MYRSSLLDAARCGIALQDDELNLFTVGFSVGEMLSDRHQKEQGGSGEQQQEHGQGKVKQQKPVPETERIRAHPRTPEKPSKKVG
ncbi:hypothetical protein KBZ17_04785 [Cyanobium sp. A2C-AMD]|nr:hypothetical protein [Cyanobium sp. A2C-AMD]